MTIRWISVTSAALLLAISGLSGCEKRSTPNQAQYTCPMHPEVVQSTPGQCPKCGMNLVRK